MLCDPTSEENIKASRKITKVLQDSLDSEIIREYKAILGIK